ncbi:helix-turn-helix domain-containing protein [Salmonella enterica subsp. enterica]|nr:helix-turn-helix domain-containing protein [Salmonella enterica subsp. enterica]
MQFITGEASPEQWAQAGRLIGAGVPRQKVAIIYDVGLSALYRKFPSGYR